MGLIHQCVESHPLHFGLGKLQNYRRSILSSQGVCARWMVVCMNPIKIVRCYVHYIFFANRLHHCHMFININVPIQSPSTPYGKGKCHHIEKVNKVWSFQFALVFPVQFPRQPPLNLLVYIYHLWPENLLRKRYFPVPDEKVVSIIWII